MLNHDDTFAPEAPYNAYTKATVSIIRRRRYITFSDQDPDAELDPNIRPTMTYARYLYQVDLWRREQRWIPEGFEVDHVNDNSLDDRLDNYQLLTRLENIRKRDRARYRGMIASPELLSEIELLLQNGYSRPLVADKLDLMPGYLRYLINTFLPRYTRDEWISIHADEIRDMLDQGLDQYDIADHYGIDQASVSRIIARCLPDYTREAQIARKVEAIRTLLTAGETLRSIAQATRCTDGNVIYLLKTYLPYLYDQWKRKRELEKHERRKRIEEGLKAGLTQTAISEQTGIPQAAITGIVNKHFPEYTKDKLYEKRVRAVGELLAVDMPYQAIAASLGLRYGVVYSIASKHFPEHTKRYTERAAAENAAHRARVGKLLAAGHSIGEVAQITERNGASISELVAKYFPQHTAKNQFYKRICSDEAGDDYTRWKAIAIARVRRLLDDGWDKVDIARLCHTNDITLITFIDKHLPDHPRAAHRRNAA